MGRVGLAAIQVRVSPALYRDEGTFLAAMDGLATGAVAALPSDLPRLLCFPEAVGLGLLFLPGAWEWARHERSLAAVVIKGALRDPRRWLKALRAGRYHPRRAFFLRNALPAWDVYTRTFAALARRHKAYVSAGSGLFPLVERESAQGTCLADPRIYNVSCLFNPQGTLVARTLKHRLTAAEARLGLSGGSRWDLQPAKTALGRVGTLVCYDAFFHSLVTQMDALGARILLQPSFNTKPWDAPWRADPARTQAEEWMQDGLPALVQDRENVRCGVNAMMVGRLFDLAGEGRSSIVGPAVRYPERAYGVGGFGALAETADQEEIVTAVVEL
jgi:predicted amidohydrolase